MRKLEVYRFRDGVTRLSAAEFNRRFFDVDARIAAIEEIRISYEEAISQLMVVVAERTALLLPPLIAAYQSSLVFFNEESARLRAEADVLILAMGADRTAQQAVLDAELASERAALDALVANYSSAVIRPNQLRGGSPATVTYNQNGQASAISVALPAGTYALAYSYDTSGRLQTVAATLATQPLWTRTYTYSTGGQLAGWTEE